MYFLRSEFLCDHPASRRSSKCVLLTRDHHQNDSGRRRSRCDCRGRSIRQSDPCVYRETCRVPLRLLMGPNRPSQRSHRHSSRRPRLAAKFPSPRQSTANPQCNDKTNSGESTIMTQSFPKEVTCVSVSQVSLSYPLWPEEG